MPESIGNYHHGQVINFWGVTGIGKTWLLSHLDHDYQKPREPHDPFSLFYSFKRPGSSDLLEFARVFAKDLLLRLGEQLPEVEHVLLKQVTETGNLENLVQVLGELSRQYVPVILLDDTEQVDHQAWEAIESRFIEPLVVTSRTLFVLAGRRYIPRWRKFEVRRRLVDPIRTQIEPFRKAEIRRQLETFDHDEADIDWLFRISAGNPRIVAAMLQNRVSPLLVLQRYSHDLFTGILSRQKEYILALSPLRYFRFEAVRYMLAGIGEGDKGLSYYDDILRGLAQTDLVWWHKEHRAYVMDGVARRIINQVECNQDVEQYKQKHRQAVKMYWGWASEYPYASEDYILEIWFHLASIHSISQENLSQEDQEKELRLLWRELEQSVVFIENNLSYERLRVLENQLFKPADIDTDDVDAGVGEHTDGDAELFDMLPLSVREKLSHALKEIIKQKEQL